MTPSDYSNLSATDIVALVKSGKVTAVDMTKAALTAAEKLEPEIHAFATLAPESALAEAAAVDARIATGEGPGPLAGVPVGIKDLVMTKGMRTTFGSALYADFIPEDDDIVVERLRAAGAVILGKTNAAEFGFGAHGCNRLFPVTRNPWDLARTPGGSSAGSGAALAAGVVPLAIGSDGGGSIRIPAAFCGLAGIKASMGRVPVWPGCRDETLPGVSGWESIEHIGPMARNVTDMALMLSVLAGPDPRDRWSLPAGDVDYNAAVATPLMPGLRVTYWPRWRDQPIDPRVEAIVTEAVERFAEVYGLELAVSGPPEIDLEEAFQRIIALETDLTGMRRIAAGREAELTPAVQGFLKTSLPLEAATDAITVRKAFANAMARVMAGTDLILTPTLPLLPFAADRTGPEEIAGVPVGPDAWCPFTSPFNLTGQPAASVPCGYVDGRWPVGLQIVGPHLGDGIVISAAAAFERLFQPQMKMAPVHV
ncbi:Glutamyl-tRNA(Gln) amidotransferase subunit A [Hartmannibacter diazotrophicus]|uniref:Glutamyl-tRNA(Gln) amidotransferase subunit A n=1 Tax=Hartmannibacter diazotrophicus TaxID=1482074 RepID=A0A2C9D4E7_9HYPH|nr:amidase [Hartmannibacter diazotrophicus]SON55038.1 Glutamyl-tRNA(Gln) amidotransferase subunit A [Hartmannibacter diazotrophicus]